MNPITPSQARTLRQLTKNGKLRTFATSLADDVHSRSLRALVDNGYLTYEYTGTQRIYTLTEACGSQFPVSQEAPTVAKKKAETAGDSQAGEGRTDHAAATHPAKGNGNVPVLPADELCREAILAGQDSAAEALKWAKKSYPDMTIDDRTFKGTFNKMKKKKEDDVAPSPTPNNGDPPPTPKKSKPHASHPDNPPPNLTDLLAVGEIAAQHGGAKKLLAHVALVDDLAKKVGGIDRLRRSLEGLETLAKLFK